MNKGLKIAIIVLAVLLVGGVAALGACYHLGYVSFGKVEETTVVAEEPNNSDEYIDIDSEEIDNEDINDNETDGETVTSDLFSFGIATLDDLVGIQFTADDFTYSYENQGNYVYSIVLNIDGITPNFDYSSFYDAVFSIDSLTLEIDGETNVFTFAGTDNGQVFFINSNDSTMFGFVTINIISGDTQVLQGFEMMFFLSSALDIQTFEITSIQYKTVEA